MKKWIAFLLVISMLVCGLAACNSAGSGGATTVSVDTAKTATELYTTIPAGEKGARECDLQASFSDDNYWYYIYYLGRVRGVPVSDISTNWFHYTGSAEITKELKIVEMTGEKIAKSVESSNTVTDAWSKELSNSLTASISASISKQISVGASAQLDFLQVGGSSSSTSTVVGSLESGFTQKYGISSSTQSTLMQYEAAEKEKTLTVEKTMTFRFVPSETKVGYYNYLTLGTVDTFAVVIYDPVKNSAGITTISEWIALYDELVYSEDELFEEAADPGQLTLDVSSLRFENPNGATTAKAYEIVYNANGGNGSMGKDVLPRDLTHSLSPNSFYRDGYKFLGWSTNPLDKDPMYTESQSVKNLAGDADAVTLYAVWLKVKFAETHTEQININEKTPATLVYDLSKQLDMERIAKYCSEGTVTSTFTTNNGGGNDNNVDRMVKLIGVGSSGKETLIISGKYAKEYGTYTHTETGSASVSCFINNIYYHFSASRDEIWNVNVQSGVTDITTTVVFR